MRRSLLILHQKCEDLGVTKIAMPQIGCGQDGLSWNDVKQMLIEIFADGFEITVYKLDEVDSHLQFNFFYFYASRAIYLAILIVDQKMI